MSRPIACELGVFDADTFARYQRLRAQLDHAIQRVEKEEDGYVVVLPGDDGTLAVVADWIALERRCCPFLSFAVSVSLPQEPIRVKLGGDADVMRFLAIELGAHTIAATSLVRPRAT